MEIWSIGGGEIVYETLKAVALCLNGGSGTLTAMLRIGGFAGAFIAYYMILYGNPLEVFKAWGVPVLLITNMLFVPTSTVWVKDTITKFHYKIDNVPYGLALFASQSSKLGKAITEIVEQSFSTPEDMKYQKNGMVFGSDILEKAKTFRITNTNFKENMRNFVGQCVKYDIMLNNKYSFDDLKNTNNLWELVTSDLSENRGIYWIPINTKKGDSAIYMTCKQAGAAFDTEWAKELDRSFTAIGRRFFAVRLIGGTDSDAKSMKMDSNLENALKEEIKINLQSITGYLGNIAESTEETLKQSLMINAIGDAASENSKLAGNAITYAETRAMQQQNSTFATIGGLAAKLLPIMKAVIEALVYACFIFIIPLCMVPSGYKFLINWAGALVWLQAWAPMYAILNFLMNIAARSMTLSEMGTAEGLTIANYMGVSEANEHIKLMAGYLSMSIPFICIAIVKGVGSFVHLAGQMTGTSMSAAGSAAAEVSSGNFSFGNISMRNQQMDNLSQLQRSYSSSLSAGGHRLDTGGVQITNDASGFSTYNRAVSSGVTDYSATNSDMEELRANITDSESKAHDASVKLSDSQSASRLESADLAKSFSKMSEKTIAARYNVGAETAKNILNDAKILDSAYNGKTFNEGTNAKADIGGSLNFGGHIGNPDSGKGAKGKGKSSKPPVGGGVSGSFNIGGSGGVHANNEVNHGESKQSMTSDDIADTQRRFDSYMKDIAASSRNDEVTNLAKKHCDTLQKIDTYSRDKAYHENRARAYQEAHSKASSLTFSERRSLNQEAWEIGQEENFGGYSRGEAERIMSSSNPQDKSVRDRWLMEAKERNQARMSPNKQSMRNTLDWNSGGRDNKGFNKEDVEKEYAAEYAAKEKPIKDEIAERESVIETGKQKVRDAGKNLQDNMGNKIKTTDKNIEQKRVQIKNEQLKVDQKLGERKKDGAGWAAAKHVKKTFWDDESND